jgi:hypothetical protein
MDGVPDLREKGEQIGLIKHPHSYTKHLRPELISIHLLHFKKRFPFNLLLNHIQVLFDKICGNQASHCISFNIGFNHANTPQNFDFILFGHTTLVKFVLLYG